MKNNNYVIMNILKSQPPKLLVLWKIKKPPNIDRCIGYHLFTTKEKNKNKNKMCINFFQYINEKSRPNIISINNKRLLSCHVFSLSAWKIIIVRKIIFVPCFLFGECVITLTKIFVCLWDNVKDILMCCILN